MNMMGGMGIMMVIVVIVGAVAIAAAVYLGVRAATRDDRQQSNAREILEQRLAAGEITTDEFYERESTLRNPGVGKNVKP